MPPTVESKAPGRVEYLGNHTDYNGGFIIAVAINGYTTAAGHLLTENVIKLSSKGINDSVELPLSILDTRDPKEITEQMKEMGKPWALFPLGIAYFMAQEGVRFNQGFNIEFAGDLPLNAGLSSSASFEAVSLNILKNLFTLPRVYNLGEEALLCQRAENQVAGSPCGIMDQFIVLKGDVIFLDCQSLEYQSLTLPDNFRLGVLDTGIMHETAATTCYPARRAECEGAADYLNKFYSRDLLTQLRGYTLDDLKKTKQDMDPWQYNRAHHVITENGRVLQARDVLLEQDLPPDEVYSNMYELMRASHESSRDYFENSCQELDIMANACWNQGLAARLSGGGFGGAVLALVKKGEESKLEEVAKTFEHRTGFEPTVRIYEVAKGAYTYL